MRYKAKRALGYHGTSGPLSQQFKNVYIIKNDVNCTLGFITGNKLSATYLKAVKKSRRKNFRAISSDHADDKSVFPNARRAAGRNGISAFWSLTLVFLFFWINLI